MQLYGKSMAHIQSVGKHASGLCGAQWAFVLETNPSLSRLKYCPLCTVPARVKGLEGFNPAWELSMYNHSKADIANLLSGVQGLTTAKQTLADLKLPQGIKRKLK
jgi:hypothetical protein